MSEADLRAEIEELRRELAALRNERAPPSKSEKVDTEAGAAAEADTGNFIDQLQTLAREISAFADDTEKGVVNHPLVSVLGALVLGVLIGRILQR